MINEKDLELYNKAKEAYYNTGEEIMSDQEFDELEKALGLENKSNVGAKHNPSYTVKHPYVMGSLSKVQIHKELVEGETEDTWTKYCHDIAGYLNKSLVDGNLDDHWKCIVTPKYDGCSFEIHVNKDGWSSSTRGDGEYGKDIKRLMEYMLTKSYWVDIPSLFKNIGHEEFTLRGEILIDKDTFEMHYKDEFTNPRSFVSGMVNSDFDESEEYLKKAHDLSIVIYDYRYICNGVWIDDDFTSLEGVDCSLNYVLPYKEFYTYGDFDICTSIEKFNNLYKKFEEIRSKSKFALDGFVIKPISRFRKVNLDRQRPDDCIAIKFIPTLQTTTIEDITWNIGKTGEYIPIIHVTPVEMDGKIVSKCSGHNFGYIMDNQLSIGCKVILSLAGDIIPFLYKIVDNSMFDVMNTNLPDDVYEPSGCHLYAKMTDDEVLKSCFLASAKTLQIPNIGDENAKKIFDYLNQSNGVETDDFFGETQTEKKALPSNILEVSPNDIEFALGGKTGKNAKKSFSELISNISLKDIINSCNYLRCGDKVSEQVEAFLLGKEYDFSHLPLAGYFWAKDPTTPEYKHLIDILSCLGLSIESFKNASVDVVDDKKDKIPVALTGNPTQYASKGQFLAMHPEYRQSGSWKEIQIVFTNDLNSTTGKMKNAIKYRKEIRQY